MRVAFRFIFFIIVSMSFLLATDWYVRPAGGNYGGENGISYDNAWDGLKSVVWGSGGVKPGDTLWVCGLHVWDYTGGAANQGWFNIVGGTDEDARITIRGDYPGDKGEIWGGCRINHESWVSEGSNTWSVHNPHSQSGAWLFQDINRGGSYTVLTKKNNVQEVKATPGSYYCANYGSQSELLYIHCSDNGNPTGRTCTAGGGYSFRMNTLGYITFLDLDVYGQGLVFGFYPIDGDWVHHVTWQGCKLIYGDKWILGFYELSHDIKIIDCEIAWAQNGLVFSSHSGNPSSDYVVKGCTIHDLGIRMPDSDSHAIGVQTWNSALIEKNYCYNCGTTFCWYAGGQAQIKNTVVRYNFIRAAHQLGGANGYGIEFGGNDNNDADKSGVQCYGNIVSGSTVGYRFKWEDQAVFYNNIAYNCGTSYMFIRMPSTGHGGPSAKLRNNISLDPWERHVYFAAGANPGEYIIDADCNLFYPVSGRQFYFYDRMGYGDETLDGWRALSKTGCTFDLNSFTNDPKFINASGSYGQDTDFQLQSSSPAIDRGVDVGLTQDRNGTSIPKGFAPDIGAYECVKSVYTRISASPTSGQIPFTVVFSGDATGDFPPFAYSWDFGDGQSSTSQNPYHIYLSTGNYTVTLTVTDNRNNMDNKSVVINAYRLLLLSLSTATGAPAAGAGGTTNPAPGTHSVVEGSSLPLNAVHNLNYRFSLWTGDVISSEIYKETTTIIMDKDKSLTTNFCSRCGDVNGDLNITPVDAQRAFDIFLGKIANPTYCEKENADVNCDGKKTAPRITPSDAQYIFDRYLGKTDLPSNCSGNSRATAIRTNRTAVSNLRLIINDINAIPGEEVLVPVIIDSSSDIKAFGFDFYFPHECFEFIRLEIPETSHGFQQVDANEIASGILRVGGYKSKAAANSPSKGLFVLVAFTFKTKNPAKSKKAGSFSILSIYDDLQNATIRNGMISWRINENEEMTKRAAGKRIDD